MDYTQCNMTAGYGGSGYEATSEIKSTLFTVMRPNTLPIKQLSGKIKYAFLLYHVFDIFRRGVFTNPGILACFHKLKFNCSIISAGPIMQIPPSNVLSSIHGYGQ